MWEVCSIGKRQARIQYVFKRENGQVQGKLALELDRFIFMKKGEI